MTGAIAMPAIPIEDAYRECARIARSHYENFTVGSLLLPRHLRQHLAALYAFARTADDVADEGEAPAEERLARLDALERSLVDCFAGRAEAPMFVALGATARELDLPVEPFQRLLGAFRSDVGFQPFPTWHDLRGYCRGSADPVGELVLRLFGHAEPSLIALSDDVCTGLQLANFWQDLSVDLGRGRLYVPLEDLERFGVGEAELRLSRTTHRVRRLLSFEVERARDLLLRGRELARHVAPRLGREVRFFAGGGLAILDRIERAGFEVLQRRPTLGRLDKARVAMSALRHAAAPLAAGAASVTPALAPAVESAPDAPTTAGTPVHDAATSAEDASIAREAAVNDGYAACRAVVRAAASSFAPAFRLLSPDRRDALCAVYAFCRHVDDIADDAGTSNPRLLLQRWREEVDAVYAGTPTRPISVALADAARRFSLRKGLLLEVIRGVETDLARSRYETFDELEEYCYRVASAVGLLCIEIFGYSSPSARDYARDLGLAFQLTNILRDVAEDAARGRIYLPREDLARFRVAEGELLEGRYSPRLAALMAFECGRARAYYLRAQGALAAEDRRSLGAAEAMRLIYERLLDRIEERNFDVFATRVTLSSYEKLGLALAGWGRSRFAAAHA
jgi:phytoene synthase